MNFKRIGRALVCLLLVCCLCFNMATIPAKASVLGQTLWILGESVIASIIKGCSVEAGEAADDFNQVVSQCWADIKADVQWYEWILGDEFMVQKFEDEEGKARYYVQLTLLEAVRQWLFDSETVSAYVNSITIDGVTFSGDSPLNVAYMQSYSSGSYGHWCTVYSTSYFESSVTAYTSKTVEVGGVEYFYRSFYLGGGFEYDSSMFEGKGTETAVASYISQHGFQGVSTSMDLIIKSLKTPSVSFATGYQDWTANSVTVEVESDAAEEEVYYPLALGQTYKETVDMTQEDVWAGNSTYVEVTVDSEITADSVAATPWATFTQWISAGWAKLETAVLSIPATVIAGIQSIFVPTEDFVTVKVEAIQTEFPFVSPIIDVGKFIGASLSGFEPSPPIIYIDLGATRGPYDIGGKVAFIDMTWYAEYKPTVDLLLSAFLWIVFWWKMFKRLPGLISGAPGDFVMEGLNMVGLADYLPSRNAAYEIQRRDNHNSVWRRR